MAQIIAKVGTLNSYQCLLQSILHLLKGRHGDGGCVLVSFQQAYTYYKKQGDGSFASFTENHSTLNSPLMLTFFRSFIKNRKGIYAIILQHKPNITKTSGDIIKEIIPAVKP